MSIIAVFLCFAAPHVVFPEPSGSNIYLLAGQSSPKSDSAFSTMLYTVKPGENILSLVRSINSGSYFIHAYYDERMIAIRALYERPEKNEMKSAIDIVDMNKLSEEIQCNATYDQNMSYLEAHLFQIPNRDLYQGLSVGGMVGKKFESRLIGINLSNCCD